jgi:hypothetical protein
MSRISNKNMTQNVRRQSVGGFRNPPAGNKVETLKLPKAVEQRLKKSIITPEMYQQMLYFAKYQPAGKRKLNDFDTSKLVIGEDIAPLSDTSGLRKGGMVSEGNVDRKPLKNKTIKLNIKNNNRLEGNPNYSSFKNNFKLKS